MTLKSTTQIVRRVIGTRRSWSPDVGLRKASYAVNINYAHKTSPPEQSHSHLHAMLARCPVICSHYGALSKRDRWHLTSDLWPGQPVICLKNSAHVSDNIFRAWTRMLKWNIQMNRNRRSVVSSNQFIRHRPNLVYLSILSRVPRYCATFIFAIFLVSTDRFNFFSQLQVTISAHIWNNVI